MRRRDISMALLGSAAASTLVTREAKAQTCNLPCYPTTEAETAAGVVPSNSSYPPGNVLRYGVDQTGIADSTAAIQRAMNVAWASGYYLHPWSGGGGAAPVVLFPPGRYRVTGTVTVPTGVTVRGAGHPAHTTNHTRIIMDSPAGQDNRNSPIFRFNRATLNNAVLMNARLCSSIEDLEFWYVTPGGNMNAPHGIGISFGSYPQGGALMFDVDVTDTRIINCVFQHAPAAIRIKNVPGSSGTRGDGWNGSDGVGMFIENCEFDASCTHIYATGSALDLQFKHCQFFGSMHRYEGCTGSVVYQAGRWHGAAYVDAATVGNTFSKFAIKGADIEISNASRFLSLNKATLIDISQNSVISGASGASWIEVTDAEGGCIVSNAINDSGYNASPGSGIADFVAAIKMRGCYRVLVSANNITATDPAIYNGFGILSGSSSRAPLYNFINGNAVTAPYNGAGFNGQNRYINVGASDILGINYSLHGTDNGFLSRNLPVQTLTVLDGASPPPNIAGKASIFVDANDGHMKAMFGDGTVRVLAQH